MNFIEKVAGTSQQPARQSQEQSRPAAPWRHPVALIPGIAFCAAIAAAAMSLRFIPGASVLSPMVVAFVVGIVLSSLLGSQPLTTPGVKFTAKTLLRFGVALLGLQLTVYQLADLGVRTLFIVAIVLVTTFLFTKWIGRLLGVDRGLTELLAAGTSVCGASAVIATNSVTRAPDQDVGYAVACVSLFGTASMILYPLLFDLLHPSVHIYGLWAGASVHEVAQVVAAAFQANPAAVDIAVPVKLARVAMLAPLVLTLGSLRLRRDEPSDEPRLRWRQLFPLFLIAFVVLVGVNSLIAIPALWHGWIALVTTFLLTMSLAAIGLETSVRDLRHRGFVPVLLTGVASLFIAVLSLTLIELFA